MRKEPLRFLSHPPSVARLLSSRQQRRPLAAPRKASLTLAASGPTRFLYAASLTLAARIESFCDFMIH